MFKLDRKLAPGEFIQTFFDANRQDHQRPPHPLGGDLSRRQVHQGTTARLGQGTLLFHQAGADQRIFDPLQLPARRRAPHVAA